MQTQVVGKFGEARVSQRLNRAHHRGGIDVVTFGHFARREETGFLAVLHDGAHQRLAARTQFSARRRKAAFNRGRGVAHRQTPGGESYSQNRPSATSVVYLTVMQRVVYTISKGEGPIQARKSSIKCGGRVGP